jgi:hypothetical protein
MSIWARFYRWYVERDKARIRAEVRQKAARTPLQAPAGFGQNDVEAIGYVQVLLEVHPELTKQEVVQDLITHYGLDEARAKLHLKRCLAQLSTYRDIGPAVGNCITCLREVYATPGAITIELVRRNQEDRIKANARWCLKCDKLYCLGCIMETDQKCSACGSHTVDHYNRGSGRAPQRMEA